MALVTYAAPAASVSGRIGDQEIVWTSSRGQGVIRQYTQPANPQSGDQDLVRAVFSTLTKRWAAVLIASQRSAWDTWAAEHPVTNRLSKVVARTGLSAYVQLGFGYWLRTGDFPTSSPTLPQPAPLTSITAAVAQDADTIRITTTHGYAVQTGLYVVARATPVPATVAVTPPLTAYRLISGVSTLSVTGLVASGTAEQYDQTLYTWIEDSIHGFEMQIMNAEGWASTPIRRVLEIGFV